MLKVYFGSVPSILSTILFLVFVVFFIKTMKNPEGGKKWKKAAIITTEYGTFGGGFRDGAACFNAKEE